MRTSLLSCLFFAATVTAQATVIGGTSTTVPLPYNQFDTYVFVFGSTNNFLAVPFTPAPGFDYILSSAMIPFRSYGPTSIDISIYDTSGGHPGTALATQSVALTADETYRLVTASFAGSTV